MPRPVLLVLAGVNGAGKSSIGGYMLTRRKLTWFNPDTFARELVTATGCSIDVANEKAWHEGLRRLDDSVARKQNYAFETTLGGRTIAERLRAASATHDVEMWYCGLSSPQKHLERIRLRVDSGGHDIPEPLVRARYVSSRRNLVELMPHLAFLRVYDNSQDAEAGDAIPDPVLVLELDAGKLVFPPADDVVAMSRTPDWARPLVEAALML